LNTLAKVYGSSEPSCDDHIVLRDIDGKCAEVALGSYGNEVSPPKEIPREVVLVNDVPVFT
jgi:hypothetical protein